MRAHLVGILGVLVLSALCCTAADSGKSGHDAASTPAAEGGAAASGGPSRNEEAGGDGTGGAPDGSGGDDGAHAGAGSSGADNGAPRGVGGDAHSVGGAGGGAGGRADGGAGGSRDSSGGTRGVGGGTGGASRTGTGGSTGSAGQNGGADPFAQVRQDCVDAINALRAQVSLPALTRWSSNESCADGQAKSDAESGDYHGAFSQCPNMAQNECPGYSSLASIVNTTDTQRGCLAMMWAEGPGTGDAHGHYTNITNTKYTQVSCGFYTTTSGKVWSVQDFK